MASLSASLSLCSLPILVARSISTPDRSRSAGRTHRLRTSIDLGGPLFLSGLCLFQASLIEEVSCGGLRRHSESGTGSLSMPPLNSSFIVGPRVLLSIPKVVATFPWGSRSTSSTRLAGIPMSVSPLASATARFTDVVVLAVPPLWLTTAMTTGPCDIRSAPSDRKSATRPVNIPNHWITGTGTSERIFLTMWCPVTPLILDSGLSMILWLTTWSATALMSSGMT